MEKIKNKKQNLRFKRKMRIRKRLRGDALKPRMSVHKSNRHIQVQIIDDKSGKTLAYASTLSKDLRGSESGKRCKTAAKELGSKIAELAIKQKIKEVMFDRGPFRYHGVLAELADAAREGGLKF